MPTLLKNGVLVYNATPHPLYFWYRFEEVVIAPSDKIVNARSENCTVERHAQYSLNVLTFHPTEQGRAIIESIKRTYPGALIVGSIIASQAYPGEVVCTVPYYNDSVERAAYRGPQRPDRLVRSDRFTVIQPKDEREKMQDA